MRGNQERARLGRPEPENLREAVAFRIAGDLLQQLGLRDRLELRHLQDHRARIVREPRIGHSVADDADHRGHAGQAIDRRLGVGHQGKAAHLPAGQGRRGWAERRAQQRQRHERRPCPR